MLHFSSEEIDIAFVDEGEGDPILLIHGFASSAFVNWGATGWVDTLKRAGRRVIAPDMRGHGQSARLYDPALYRVGLMARDCANLLDHLEIPRADIMGYSMGGRIAAFFALDYPARTRSLIIGGLGLALVEGMAGADAIVRALEAPSSDGLTDETGLAYRKFAEATGSDLKALAACMRSARETLSPEQLAGIRAPALVAVGERDAVAGSPEGLARLIAGAELLVIARRDHMLATADKTFKAAVLDFLARRP
jgi:pimeloyl-ACP methyl ester carboxylesterase